MYENIWGEDNRVYSYQVCVGVFFFSLVGGVGGGGGGGGEMKKFKSHFIRWIKLSAL